WIIDLFPLLPQREKVPAKRVDERLSGLSSLCEELSSQIAGLCVELDKELSRDGDADGLLGLGLFTQPAMEVGEVRIMSSDQICDDVEDGADGSAPAADAPSPLEFAAVLGQGSQSGELGDGL